MPKSSTSSGSRKARASSGSRSSASTSRADTASSRRTDTGKRKYRRTASWNPLDHHLPPRKKRAGGVPEVMTDEMGDRTYGIYAGSTLDRNAAARRRYAPAPATTDTPRRDALRSYLLPRMPHSSIQLDLGSRFDPSESFYRAPGTSYLQSDRVADNRQGLENGYGLQPPTQTIQAVPYDITTSPGWPHELARRRAAQDDRDAAARERAGRFVADRVRYLRHRSLLPGAGAVREAARRYRGITQEAFDAAWEANASAGLPGPSRPPRASATSTPRRSGSASSSSTSSAAQRTARARPKRGAVKRGKRRKPAPRTRRR